MNVHDELDRSLTVEMGILTTREMSRESGNSGNLSDLRFGQAGVVEGKTAGLASAHDCCLNISSSSAMDSENGVHFCSRSSFIVHLHLGSSHAQAIMSRSVSSASTRNCS